jgi:hypothetical protein
MIRIVLCLVEIKKGYDGEWSFEDVSQNTVKILKGGVFTGAVFWRSRVHFS